MSVILTDAEYASRSAQKAKSTSIITYIQASYYYSHTPGKLYQLYTEPKCHIFTNNISASKIFSFTVLILFLIIER